MKKAYLFPGQGSQFTGMGKDLFDNDPKSKELFLRANDILGFNITEVMFKGSEEDLKQTNVTQPAIFLHSAIMAKNSDSFAPDMVAGHSLGEFSALVASGSLSFESGLSLVYKRAIAMQKACETAPGAMAAILALDDKLVDEICKSVDEGIVVAANYNCPGQLVISGSIKGVEIACEKLKAAGAKRALILPVGGAFHSPLMKPAEDELRAAIESTHFEAPVCPVYQNVTASAQVDPEKIKANLIKQLTAPVRWTETIQNMSADGAGIFIECGPGKVLQGLVRKIKAESEVMSI